MEKSKKSLGQNFLLNKEKIKEIVGALDVKSGDTVVEIGPGHGEITRELRIRNKELRIIAIEKDENLARNLEDGIGDEKTKIIEGDVLKMLPSIIHNSLFKIQDYKLVGNIPYYITGFLLRTISELKNKPSITVLTVQKEVAKRICGEMSLLSASVRYWAEPEIIGIIPKSDFSPQPKVDSAIIRLKTRENNWGVGDGDKKAENYYRFIKILFKQPRKTALNNLMGTKINKNELEKMLGEAGVRPNARPQDLKMTQLEILAEKTASNVVY
ncbi:MAG: 16S rRNA (adenine(1518)-N(6)/adenine(1519)-N(6))-dimethyltransferase RsmA [Patescibacteria group bacterium]